MEHADIAQAGAALNIVHEIATLLDTGLDKDEVAILIALIENGVNPEVKLVPYSFPMSLLLLASQKIHQASTPPPQALAEVVKELRREGAALKAAEAGARQ